MYEIQRIGKVMWTEIIQVLKEMIIHVHVLCLQTSQNSLRRLIGHISYLSKVRRLQWTANYIYVQICSIYAIYSPWQCPWSDKTQDTIMNPSTCKCCLEQKHKGVLFGIVGKSSLFSQSVAQVYNCHLSVSY